MATSTERTTTGTDPDRTVRPDAPDVITDGRQLRRERNREAVVEALLDLYREGNLRPSTEEIAIRSGLSPRSLFRYFDDVDDLTRTAVRHQHERAQPLVPIGAGPHEPLTHKVDALVAQRFRLFDAVGNAAAVARLRAPFQPVLGLEVRRNRAFLRSQIEELFAPELAGMAEDRASAALAAADVLTSFESCRLLLGDQALRTARARAVVVLGLLAILGPSR
jgi:AcrR family transcriptional regulator